MSFPRDNAEWENFFASLPVWLGTACLAAYLVYGVFWLLGEALRWVG